MSLGNGARVRSSQNTWTVFRCPQCDALYDLFKVEAGPETVDREITCRACGASLPSRERQYALKYFLLRDDAKYGAVLLLHKIPKMVEPPAWIGCQGPGGTKTQTEGLTSAGTCQSSVTAVRQATGTVR